MTRPNRPTCVLVSLLAAICSFTSCVSGKDVANDFAPGSNTAVGGAGMGGAGTNTAGTIIVRIW
jgi:hypothetical protein